MLSQGFKQREIARRIGKPDAWVSAQVSRVRRDLVSLALERGGEMPPPLRNELQTWLERTEGGRRDP